MSSFGAIESTSQSGSDSSERGFLEGDTLKGFSSSFDSSAGSLFPELVVFDSLSFSDSSEGISDTIGDSTGHLSQSGIVLLSDLISASFIISGLSSLDIFSSFWADSNADPEGAVEVLISSVGS